MISSIISRCRGQSWDDRLPAGVDPSMSWLAVAAAESRGGVEPVLIEISDGGQLVAVHALLILSSRSCRLARTPTHAGPWTFAANADHGAIRDAIDSAVDELGVASHVVQFSPFCPSLGELRTVWRAHPMIQVAVAELGSEEEAFRTLPKGRRSDIARSRRSQDFTFEKLRDDSAKVFADLYRSSMDRNDALESWNRPDTYFRVLAAESTEVHGAWLGRASDDEGGAAALFLVGPRHATYAYAVRWGRPNGSPSRVLWEARCALADRGVEALLLGGGTTTAEDDPLLRFKRSLGTTTTDHLISGRVYDRAAHGAAVAAGFARDLPPGSIDVGRAP